MRPEEPPKARAHQRSSCPKGHGPHTHARNHRVSPRRWPLRRPAPHDARDHRWDPGQNEGRHHNGHSPRRNAERDAGAWSRYPACLMAERRRREALQAAHAIPDPCRQHGSHKNAPRFVSPPHSAMQGRSVCALRRPPLAVCGTLAVAVWCGAGGAGGAGACELAVDFPKDGSRVTSAPLHVRYTASVPCRSALAVDGLVVSFFDHTAGGGLTADVRMPAVSLDRHALSLDVVDADGGLVRRGPRWSVEMGVDEDSMPAALPGVAAAEHGDATADWYPEPVQPYDPHMSEEEMSQAELVDGWWLVKQDNFEFTRPEPTDTCEDLGWRARAAAQRPRRIWSSAPSSGTRLRVAYTHTRV